MKAAQRRFLIVDDDPQNNIISKMALRKSLGEVQVTDFIIPERGLEYIQSEFTIAKSEKTILLLDLNMPTMSGWEFLEKFETLEDQIKNQFDIYILSSSVDPREIEKARENPLVINFIEKPLGKKMLLEMFG